MAGKKHQLNGKLQAVFKVLFSVLTIMFLIIILREVLKQDYLGIIIAGSWFIISGVIFLRIIKTEKISFDDHSLYVSKEFFKNKNRIYNLKNVYKIRTSFDGYFTNILLYDDQNRKKKFTCFNNHVSALKYNKTDPLGINKSIISNSREESDKVLLLKERVKRMKN